MTTKLCAAELQEALRLVRALRAERDEARSEAASHRAALAVVAETRDALQARIEKAKGSLHCGKNYSPNRDCSPCKAYRILSGADS